LAYFYLAGLWFVTYTLTILTLRIAFPSHQTVATAVGIVAIFLIYEVPILLTMSPAVHRVAGNVGESFLGLVMMIPQGVALLSLILWVNFDPTVYDYENGCFVLGMFFWAELIILTGWLYDRCMGKEIDPTPVYPHFFADLFYSE
jgi:hypothetical protein